MLPLTHEALRKRVPACPHPVSSEHPPASCECCQAEASALGTSECIEEIKRRLGFHTYRRLGVVEAIPASDGTVLFRYRSPVALCEEVLAWQQAVEIPVDMLCLRITGIHTGEGTLLYARVGSGSAQDAAGSAPQPGLELTLIAADTPIRSSTPSPEGQAIFHLTPGFFTLLLHQQTGWELRLIRLSE